MSSWNFIGAGTSEPEPTYINLKTLGREENEGRLCRTIGVVREENLPYDIYIEQPWSGAEIQVYQARLIKFQIEWYRITRFNPCGGYIQFMLKDLYPQVGYGVIDAARRPKAAFDAVKAASTA